MGDMIDWRIPLKNIWSAYIMNGTNTYDQNEKLEFTAGYIKDGIFINEKNERYQIYSGNNYTEKNKYVHLIEQRYKDSEESVNIFEIKSKLEEELQQVKRENNAEICKKDIWSAYIIGSTNTYDQKRTLRLTVGCVKDGIFTNEKNMRYKIYDRKNYIVGNEYVGLIEQRFPHNEEVLSVSQTIPIMKNELQKILNSNGVIHKEDIWSVCFLVGTSTHNATGGGEPTVGYIKDGIFTSITGEKYPFYDKNNIATGVEYASKIQSCFENDKEILRIFDAILIMKDQLQQIRRDGGVILKGDNIETDSFVK